MTLGGTTKKMILSNSEVTQGQLGALNGVLINAMSLSRSSSKPGPTFHGGMGPALSSGSRALTLHLPWRPPERPTVERNRGGERTLEVRMWDEQSMSADQHHKQACLNLPSDV